jgi:hypothetical protein
MSTTDAINLPVTPKKKGRPRKENIAELSADLSMLQVDDNKQEPEKKKRGRKKKEVVADEGVKQKKKRGRKAAVKYFSSSIRKKMPLTTVMQDSNNFILHLDVKEDELDNTSLTYDTIEKSGDKIMDSMFEKLKHDEVADVKKEIEEMLDDDILDGEDEHDLPNLYERRIEFRENQDKLLVDKLETLHKDDTFIRSLLQDSSCKEPEQEKQRDTVQNVNRKKGYFELLYPFLHNTEWLEKTDISCWWCCHEFDTLPIGLPVHYCIRVHKFRVKGVFCSFACLMAYKTEKRIQNIDSLIKYLYQKLTGTAVHESVLQSAPPRCALQMFGGELTIEQFRESSRNNLVYKMVEYPMFVSKDYVEEVDIANVKNANTKIFDDTSFAKVVDLDDKRVQDAKLRLSQIEKTTITGQNTIDKFIKFS